MDAEVINVLLESYERFRRQVRILCAGIIILAGTSFFAALDRINERAEEYQAGVDLILSERNDSAIRNEAKSLYSEKLQEIMKKGGRANSTDSITVSMMEIHRLYRKYVRPLDARNSGKEYKLWNFSVNVYQFALAIYFGPIALLLFLLWPLLSIRALHEKLYTAAQPDGKVQLKLNSLFFDRVTSTYAEGWKRHVVLSLVVISFLAFCSSLSFIATYPAIEPDLNVCINNQGMIHPINDDPKKSLLVNDSANHSLIGIEFIITSVLIALITAVLLRIALSIIYAEKKCAKSNHAIGEGAAAVKQTDSVAGRS
jgi:hypothetical protein